MSFIKHIKNVRLKRLTTKHRMMAITLGTPLLYSYIQPKKVASPANNIWLPIRTNFIIAIILYWLISCRLYSCYRTQFVRKYELSYSKVLPKGLSLPLPRNGPNLVFFSSSNKYCLLSFSVSFGLALWGHRRYRLDIKRLEGRLHLQHFPSDI